VGEVPCGHEQVGAVQWVSAGRSNSWYA